MAAIWSCSDQSVISDLLLPLFIAVQHSFFSELVRALDVVELSVPHATKECIPFSWRESEDSVWFFLAMANSDIPVRETCYFNAVAVTHT